MKRIPDTHFTLPEAAGLPGLPILARDVCRRATRAGWHGVKRPFGKGLMYPIELLPTEARAALLVRRMREGGDGPPEMPTPTPPAPPASPAAGGAPLARRVIDPEICDPFLPPPLAPAGTPQPHNIPPAGAALSLASGEDLSAWAARQPERARAEGLRRVRAVQALMRLAEGGISLSLAARQVAVEVGASRATLCRWMRRVDGRPETQWHALLIPARFGGGRNCSIPAEAWDVFKADYLRLAKPAASACYERLQRIAAERGWPELPSCRAFLRRLRKEIHPSALIYGREGREALMRSYPAQERDRTTLHAMEAVNADGHVLDFIALWPDGVVARPIMVAFQDIYSGRPLSWAVDRTENKDLIRTAFGIMVERFGVPRHCVFDNGRGFAAKCLTGGTTTRYRFKILDEDPEGIIVALGCVVHWATPYHGQSKPIERMFRDLCCERIARHPSLVGACTGNDPKFKPEDHRSRAVPIAEVMSVIEAEWAAFCARPGRRTSVCAGRSLDETFFDSYARSEILRVGASQRRLFLLAAENVRTHRETGEFRLFGNRYWSERMTAHKSEMVIVRFDDNLHERVYVYDFANRPICEAECIAATGFFDAKAAKEFNSARNRYKKDAARALESERRMTAAAVAGMLPPPAPEPAIPLPAVVGGVFGLGGGGGAALGELSAEDVEMLKDVAYMKEHFNAARKGI